MSALDTATGKREAGELCSGDSQHPRTSSISEFISSEPDSSVGPMITSNNRVQKNETRFTIMRETVGNFKTLLFGQFLSLFLAGTSAIQSSLYLSCGLSAPTFSMFTFYFPLTIITLSRLIYQSRYNSSYTWQSSSLTEDEQEQQIECQSNTTSRHTKHVSKLSPTPKIITGATMRAKLEKRNYNEIHESTQFSTEEDNDDHLMTSIGNTTNTSACKEHSEGYTSDKKSHSLFEIVPLKCNPLLYAAVAATDVYANYATILAFKYTTLTSVSLLDALSIPTAIILSRLAFSRRYTKKHTLGVLICFIGITINALQDYREDKALEMSDDAIESEQERLVEADYPHKMLGDVLAIIGGILFGIDNTLQEVAVREWGTQLEYLACMTFFATIISFVQALILERGEILSFFLQSESDSCPQHVSLLLLSAFSIGGMISYLGIASFLRISDAAFLNLSLLTGDAWAVLYSVYAEHISPSGTFYVALVITVTGVFIYETAPSPVIVEKNPERLGEIHLVENDSSDNDREADPPRIV